MVQKWSIWFKKRPERERERERERRKKRDLKLEIILFLLKKKKEHVRAIAKFLKESHSTVLRKLNEFIKEDVLDFKKEGRNKTFFINKNFQARSYIFRAEEYKLTRLSNKYSKLNILLPILLNWVAVNNILTNQQKKIIVIFGDYAKFKVKKNSDINIYIETQNKQVKKELESINPKIKIEIGEFDKSSLLIQGIIKDHIILEGVEEFYDKINFFK